MTVTYIPVEDTLDQALQALDRWFPGVDFSLSEPWLVEDGNPDSARLVPVHWIDGPTPDAVDEVLERYSTTHWKEFTDINASPVPRHVLPAMDEHGEVVYLLFGIDRFVGYREASPSVQHALINEIEGYESGGWTLQPLTEEAVEEHMALLFGHRTYNADGTYEEVL